MRFVLLIGCLSLRACAALVTMRLPSLNRKVAFPAPRSRNSFHKTEEDRLVVIPLFTPGQTVSCGR